MKLLLATAHPYMPEIRGGAQSSMHEMALAMVVRGHEAAVLAGLAGVGVFGFGKRVALKLRSDGLVRDCALGYPVYRGWFPWTCADEVMRRFAPDVIMAFSGLPARMGNAFAHTGVARIVYLRNVEQDDMGGILNGSADVFIANSQFTADYAAEMHGVSALVIPPMIAADQYRVESSRQYITFINPHPCKGRDIAFDLARDLPNEEFLFVKAWSLNREDEEKLRAVERECGNVTVREPTNNMASIYRQTKLVIAPSRWNEAWGRVASEAQVSGIPIVASAVGGLPEAVGPGGLLLPPTAPRDEWRKAVQSIVTDPEVYDKLSKAAFEHAQRTEFREDVLLDRIVAASRTAICQNRNRNRVTG
ncbi:glycosyltransferase [Qipengyuania spongiae]|uniref:Glycosyltransferase n=1 Tax=Qipengyuania spongiae TaxID=2909673 RepID=A0ABY5SYG0_9SPHN|nr:glycosyltransferase [Qipengyuania spongiae]UVI39563.1 glycosyltransferase [Qipengyuania spongiae]